MFRARRRTRCREVRQASPTRGLEVRPPASLLLRLTDYFSYSGHANQPNGGKFEIRFASHPQNLSHLGVLVPSPPFPTGVDSWGGLRARPAHLARWKPSPIAIKLRIIPPHQATLRRNVAAPAGKKGLPGVSRAHDRSPPAATPVHPLTPSHVRRPRAESSSSVASWRYLVPGCDSRKLSAETTMA